MYSLHPEKASKASSNCFLHLHPYNFETETIDSLRNPSIAIRKISTGVLPRSRARDGWPADSRASRQWPSRVRSFALSPAGLALPSSRRPPAALAPAAPTPRELPFRADSAPEASRSSHGGLPPLSRADPAALTSSPSAPAASRPSRRRLPMPSRARLPHWRPRAPCAGGSRCPPELAFRASRGSPELASCFSHASSSRRPAPPGPLLLPPSRP